MGACLGSAAAVEKVDMSRENSAQATRSPHPSLMRLTATQRTLLSLVNPLGSEEPLCDVNWTELRGTADRLWLGPRLGFQFSDHAPPEIPLSLLEHWRAARRGAAAWNLLLAGKEGRVREALAAAGVEAIPLKGVSLARILHGDPAARSVGDVDLGVRPSTVARAAEVLAQIGYSVALPPSLLARRAFLRSTDEYTSEVKAACEQSGVDLLVELHWKWMPHGEDAVWSSLHLYQPAGVRTLAPEMYLLFLCSHVAGGGWHGMRWLLDVGDFLVRFGPILDAAACLRRAQQGRMTRAVGITLAFLNLYWGIRHPGLDKLRDAAAVRQAGHYRARPFTPFLTGSVASIHRDRLRLQDNAWQGLRYLGRLAFPTYQEWVTAHGQLRAAPAAWVLRAARLASLGATSLLSSNGAQQPS